MTDDPATGRAARGRILVVDDEPQIQRALGTSLRAAGYEVASALTAEEAVRSAAVRPPDAIILDLMLPDESGVEVCRRVREWSRAPVIVVSALSDEADTIEALDAGADDYVTKPYSTRELLARLRAALRRSAVAPGEESLVRFGDVEVDLPARVVRRADRRVHLTVREYELLAALARHPGRVMTHRALLQTVWGPRYGEETHYLRVYMANLRKKLEPDPSNPRSLLTETGIGYRLEAG